MVNFIFSNRKQCPSCYSRSVSEQGGTYTCDRCGETWSQEDSNLAQGMAPLTDEEREEARKRTLEKLDESDFDL